MVLCCRYKVQDVIVGFIIFYLLRYLDRYSISPFTVSKVLVRSSTFFLSWLILCVGFVKSIADELTTLFYFCYSFMCRFNTSGQFSKCFQWCTFYFQYALASWFAYVYHSPSQITVQSGQLVFAPTLVDYWSHVTAYQRCFVGVNFGVNLALAVVAVARALMADTLMADTIMADLGDTVTAAFHV